MSCFRLILDEPFTSLDAISEKKCLKVLQNYTTGMKGIIISHKMNNISQFAEDIYVLENGTISEHGRHADHRRDSIRGYTRNM